jgi:3-oxoacyl-[acyl-carrier protein] reductase
MAAPLRRFVVTGAASGIGAATVAALAGEGTAFVLSTRRNEEGLAAIAERAWAKGAKVATVLGDLADPDTPSRLIGQAVRAWGGIDVIVANAGFSDQTPITALDAEAMARSFLPLTVSFQGLLAAASPHWPGAADARVIAVSSFVAHVFRRNHELFAASAAAKAGLEALVKVAAIALAPQHVTVNAVVPGVMRKEGPGRPRPTPDERWRHVEQQIPLGRLGEPEDVAAAIAWFASPAASYVTGQLLHVSGGLAP